MANRYWVGGAGNWSDTAHWSATSGGASGASVPTASDAAIFDQAGTYTAAVDSGTARCLDLTVSAGVVTFSAGSPTPTLTISGSCSLLATTVTTGSTLTFLFNSTATGKTVTTNGASMACLIVFNGTGGGWTLGSALTTSSSVTLTRGALALSTFTLSCDTFSSSNTNTRSIAFGTGSIALTSTTAGATVLDMGTLTGFTWTGTGGFTRAMGATATVAVGSAAGGSASTAVNLTVTGNSALTITKGLLGSYFKNLIFSSGSAAVNAGGGLFVAGNLTLSASGTYSNFLIDFISTGTATLTTNGVSLDSSITLNSPGTLLLGSAVVSSASFTLQQGTLNLNGFDLSVSSFSSSNTNTRAVAFGANNIALTSSNPGGTVLSMGTATGFSRTGTGGFTRAMGAAATVNFGGTAGATSSNVSDLTVTGNSTLTFTANSAVKNLVFSSGSTAVTATGVSIYGNLTLSATGTYSSMVPTFAASGTLTTNGKSLGASTLNSSGGTLTLAGALTVASGNAFTLSNGTFDANNQNVTVDTFQCTGPASVIAIVMGSGTWTINGAGAAWYFPPANYTALTVTAGTATINMTSASLKSFVGPGKTWPTLNNSGAGELHINGSAQTFDTLSNSVSPTTLSFVAGSTTTVSTFDVNGTAGNPVALASGTPGSQFTLSKASGTVASSYLTIQDSIATGGATWNDTNGTDSGNNTGWNFLVTAATSGFFAFFR